MFRGLHHVTDRLNPCEGARQRRQGRGSMLCYPSHRLAQLGAVRIDARCHHIAVRAYPLVMVLAEKLVRPPSRRGTLTVVAAGQTGLRC